MKMQDRSQSEFNYAISFLNRLNQEFQVCSNAKFDLDLKMWMDSLVVLFTELSDDMKQKEVDESKKKLKELYEKVNIFVSKQNRGLVKGIDPKLYWELIEFELFLRKIVKDSGYKTKIIEEAFEALK